MRDACRPAIGEPFGSDLLLLREINGGSGGSWVSFDKPLPEPTDDRETVDGLLAMLTRFTRDGGTEGSIQVECAETKRPT